MKMPPVYTMLSVYEVGRKQTRTEVAVAISRPSTARTARYTAATADRFEGVEDDSVDLVFAGQTTEHLWAHELTGFLLQAHRVLHVDGLLVMDSPN